MHKRIHTQLIRTSRRKNLRIDNCFCKQEGGKNRVFFAYETSIDLVNATTMGISSTVATAYNICL